MTARQVWEGMLTELSKVNAPSMLLEDFNYFINKAINQYINKRYNIYDINQQTTDDLRVLKATAILDVNESKKANTAIGQLSDLGAGLSKLFSGTYETTLPSDYLHILNCICIYRVKGTYKCYDDGNYVQFPAKRLTADSWSVIVNDYYNRPLPERPYFYIHNININNTLPTNPITDTNPNGTDLSSEYIGSPTEIRYYLISAKDGVAAGTRVYVKDGVVYKEDTYATEINGASIDDLSTKRVEGKTTKSNFPRTIKLGKPDSRTVSTVERDTGTRYGNVSNVRMEIRYGQDNSVFILEKVLVDYIKAPQTIRLTQEQVNLTQDTSQIMEFPDYVCQEIINELTMLVMENTADPRLQTNPTVTQSIANPAHQQAPQPQPQQA